MYMCKKPDLSQPSLTPPPTACSCDTGKEDDNEGCNEGGSCPASGWQPWPDTDSCYRLQEEPSGLRWHEARALCQQEPGGDLVSITSHLENQRECIL